MKSRMMPVGFSRCTKGLGPVGLAVTLGMVHVLMVGGGPALASPRVEVIDPYADIDWEADGRHKANLHSHTLRNRVMEDGSVLYGDHRKVDGDGEEIAAPHPEWSWRPSEHWHPDICTRDEGRECECCHGSDGQWYVDELIDWYYDHDYTILSITDHNKSTWPWTKWHRDPDELGMLAVRGNEASTGHHMLALFTDLGWETRFHDTERRELLEMIGDDGGLAILAHPGFYAPPLRDEHWFEIDWYVELFRDTYEVMNGIEARNGAGLRGDWNCLWTWDMILDELMPEMPIWGFAPDDAHSHRGAGSSYDMFYLPELTKQSLRHAIRNGHSTFSTERDYGNHGAPRIASITVDEDGPSIQIQADDSDEIRWIAGHEEVASGATINYVALHEQDKISNYVRAEIENEHGITYTQPFAIVTTQP